MNDYLAIHAGMPDEVTRLRYAFPDVPIFAGQDKFKLPALVSSKCKRIVCMGLCGGLAPPLKVADTAAALNLVDKAGDVMQLRSAWMDQAIAAAAAQGITINLVPWYSSGLLDEADTGQQRAAIYNKYPTRPKAIDDESRYSAALAKARGIEFGVIRPLSDDWTETLPLEARGAIMNPDGSPNLKYLRETFHIEDTVQLEQIGIDYYRSLDALEAVAKAVAPVLAQF